MTPTGLDLRRSTVTGAARWLLAHGGLTRSVSALSRDEAIRVRHAAGEGMSNLAREFGISPQRVWQIVRA